MYFDEKFAKYVHLDLSYKFTKTRPVSYGGDEGLKTYTYVVYTVNF